MEPSAKAQSELRLARQALDVDDDPRHAAHHAASAMAHAPLNSEVRAVVAHLLSIPEPGAWGALKRWWGSKDVAPLFPDDGYAGNQAVRAWALEKRGAHSEAVAKLLSIAMVMPNPEFLAWAVRCVQESPEPVDPGTYFTAFGHVGAATIGLLHLKPTEQAFFAPWSDLADALVAKVAPEHREMVLMSASALARRAGRLDRAEALATTEDPHPLLDTARGLALRAQGKMDEARWCFKRAAAHASQDPTVFAFEIARVHFDEARWVEARTQLERFPDAWEEEQRVTVRVIDELTSPDVPRAFLHLLGPRPKYDDLRRLVLGQAVHEPMMDASVNVIPQFGDQPPPVDIKMGLSSMEAPSAVAALAFRCLGRPDPTGINYDYGGVVPNPLPYEPLDPLRGVKLWRLEGSVAVPALAPPPPEVTAWIDTLLTSLSVVIPPDTAPSFSTVRAWSRVKEDPQVHGFDPEALMAAMLYPTAPGRWADTALWVYDRQVVAALALGAQEFDRSWLSSKGRDNLRRLIYGPSDWTLAAALIATRQVVLDKPSALEDAHEWADFLTQHQPSLGHNCWQDALRRLLMVPGLSPELLQRLPEPDRD